MCVLIFSKTFVSNGTIFGEEGGDTEHKMCVLIFTLQLLSQTALFSGRRGELLNTECVFWFSLQLLSQILFILRRTERVIIINALTSSSKVPVIVVRFHETLIFSTDFRKIIKYQILWISFQWKPSCSKRSKGRTDRHDEANSRFSQFCESA
jgi:hypothetical protein